MMWSQCKWDMNMWKVCALCGPWAMMLLPSSRKPLPMSQMTYSSPPVSICTQEELPPNVCETAKSGTPATKARALASVSSFLPDAATSALTSFSWSAAVSRETGSEPRVPQKRISMAGGLRSSRPIRGERRGRELRERIAHARKARYHEGEPADLEDFPDHRLQRRHRDRSALRFGLLGREHQDAQPDAADVFDPGKI